MAFIKIHGVLPPMITPFTKEGEIDLEGHKFNVKRWNEIDLAGYLVLGSNSEAVYLNREEKLDLIKATVEVAKEGKLIMAGTGVESTRETIALTNAAAKAGAHCALILTPNYYGAQMGDEAQIQFFTDVADAVDIPILIYNVTNFTHINISPRAVQVLAKHPNIIGMKDSSGNIPQLMQFKAVFDPEEFNLIVGTASAWYPALDLGIKASIMALANCCPQECVRMQTLYDAGRREEAKELYARLFPVNHVVTATYGVAGLKYVCDELGYKGGFVRRPLLDLNDEKKKALQVILKKAEIL